MDAFKPVSEMTEKELWGEASGLAYWEHMLDETRQIARARADEIRQELELRSMKKANEINEGYRKTAFVLEPESQVE